MKPWDTMRREIAGGWRSLRYDLDRRADGDDSWLSRPIAGREPALRDPRRAVTAAGVAGIIVTSAVGTYFAAVGGLGMLIADVAGVPVVPQAVPMIPVAPIPQIKGTTSAGKPHHKKHKMPPKQTEAEAQAQAPVAPAPARRPVPAGPVVTHRPPLPEGTTTTPGRTPEPEGTTTVTPSQSPSANPSPSASAAPEYHAPDSRR